MKKYGLVVGIIAAVIIVLVMAYTLPLSQPSAKPKQLGLTADNFFKIRVGEDAPFFAAGRGGIKPYQFTWDFGDGSQSQLQNLIEHEISVNERVYVVAILSPSLSD